MIFDFFRSFVIAVFVVAFFIFPISSVYCPAMFIPSHCFCLCLPCFRSAVVVDFPFRWDFRISSLSFLGAPDRVLHVRSLDEFLITCCCLLLNVSVFPFWQLVWNLNCSLSFLGVPARVFLERSMVWCLLLLLFTIVLTFPRCVELFICSLDEFLISHCFLLLIVPVFSFWWDAWNFSRSLSFLGVPDRVFLVCSGVWFLLLPF